VKNIIIDHFQQINKSSLKIPDTEEEGNSKCRYVAILVQVSVVVFVVVVASLLLLCKITKCYSLKVTLHVPDIVTTEQLQPLCTLETLLQVYNCKHAVQR
jgi:hypothetical protein